MKLEDLNNANKIKTRKIFREYWGWLKILRAYRGWLVVFLILAVGSLLVVSRLLAAAGDPRLFFEPVAGSYRVGENFNVSVYLDSDVPRNPYPANTIVEVRASLNFDQDYLAVREISFSGTAFGGYQGNLPSNYYWDNTSGLIDITFTEPDPGVPRDGQDPNRLLLATINFEALDWTAEANVSFSPSLTYIRYQGGAMVEEDYGTNGPGVSYTIRPNNTEPCQGRVFLRPEEDDFVLGDNINIDVMIETNCPTSYADITLRFIPSDLSLTNYVANSNLLTQPLSLDFSNTTGGIFIEAHIDEFMGTTNLVTLTFAGQEVVPNTTLIYTQAVFSDVLMDNFPEASVLENGTYSIEESVSGKLGFENVEASPTACGGGWCAAISWNTTNPATTPRVRYGTSPGNYSSSADGAVNSSASFNAELTGLSAGQIYYYQVCNTPSLEAVAESDEKESWWSKFFKTRKARAQVPKVVCSAENSFVTSAGEGLSILSGPELVAKTHNSATVKWVTSKETGTNSVEWRGTGTGWQQGPVMPGGGTQHVATLTGLTPETTYTGIVFSREGSQTVRGDFVFKTAAEASFGWDANVILQVDRDRVCDKWLFCDSAVEITNKYENKEERCFHVGLCDEMDENGEYCKEPVFPLGGNQTFLINTDNPELTDIDGAKNLTGYSKVGAEWVVGGNSYKVDGFYPYANMEETGGLIHIANGDFELDDESYYPWKQIHYKYGECEETLEPAKQNNNQYLLMTPFDVAGDPLPCTTEAGVYIYLGSYVLNTSTDYFVSFDLKMSGPPKDDDDEILVKLVRRGGGMNEDFDEIKVDDWPLAWRRIVVGPLNPESTAGLDRASLQIVYNNVDYDAGEGPTTKAVPSMAIDNVEIKPVLPYQSRDDGSELAASPTCRLYPDSSAPACDYINHNSGQINYGWKGYCVEKDPKNENMCLQWWPVDIISGSASAFNREDIKGYGSEKDDRYPLYYCLEAKGNYRGRGFCMPTFLCDAEEAATHRTALGCGAGLCLWVDANDAYKMHTYYHDRGPDNGRAAAYTSGCDRSWNGDNYTFKVCPEDYAPTDLEITLEPFHPEYHLLEEEIAAVSIEAVYSYKSEWPAQILISRDKFGATEKIAGSDYQYRRDEEAGINNVWWRVEGTCEQKKSNCIKFGLKFNSKRQLVALSYNGLDDTGTQEETGAYLVYFYLREPCMTLAKVITEDGAGKPRLLKLRQENHSLNNALRYKFDQDFLPYGAAVVPTPVSNPGQWRKFQPLFVEPSRGLESLDWRSAGLDDLNVGTVRAGSPYGIIRPIEGYLGPGTCVSGSRVGGMCNNHDDCGMGTDQRAGHCVGITFSQDSQDSELGGSPGNSYWKAVDDELSGWGLLADPESAYDPALRLKELFAKSYGIWQWDGEMGQYRLCGTGPDMWDGCRLGLTGVDSTIYKLDENGQYNFDFTNEGQRPMVPNEVPRPDDKDKDRKSLSSIKINEKVNVNIPMSSAGSIMLKFNSMVVEDQMPLVRYSVDWGDGKVTTEAGLRTGGRSDPENPHVLTHYYSYHKPNELYPDGSGDNYGQHGCTDEGCGFRPCIQIEDNWGLCNVVDENADPPENCGKDDVFWTCYPKYVIVDNAGSEGEYVPPTPQLAISQNRFDINVVQGAGGEQTVWSEVSNSGSGELSWSVADYSYFNDPPFAIYVEELSGGPLGVGGSESMSIRVTYNSSLGVGNYTKSFQVMDISQSSDPVTVTVGVNVRLGSGVPPLEAGDFVVDLKIIGPTSIQAGQTVNFSAVAIFQPDWAPDDDILYQFDFNRDGRVDYAYITNVPGEVVSTSYRYTTAGSYTPIVVVTNMNTANPPEPAQIGRAWGSVIVNGRVAE